MSQAVRVDDVVFGPDGQMEIRFTSGTSPLPASWSGEGWNPGTRSDLLGELASFGFQELTLLRFLLAAWAAKDATLTQLAQIRGKSITVDLTASQTGQIIKLN